MSLRCFVLIALPMIAGVSFLLRPFAASAAEGSLEIFPDARILIQLVLFVACIVPLHRLLFRPILRALEERRERVEKTIQRAKEIEDQADAVLARYESAMERARDEIESHCKELVVTARREALEAIADSRTQTDRHVAEARSEILQSLKVARQSLRDQSIGLARDVASKILGRTV